MRTKSILYNIYSLYSGELCTKDVIINEFYCLLYAIIAIIENAEYSCKVHISVGNYTFVNNESISLTIAPQIHIVITGTHTSQIEQLIEQEIERKIFYNHYEKFLINKNALNKFNINLLNKYSLNKYFINVKHRINENKLSVQQFNS